jgi:predicted exporter
MSGVSSKFRISGEHVWFAGVCVLLVLAAYKWDGARSVDSNFLALLPETPHDAIVTAASNRLVHATEDRMIWLVGSTVAPEAAAQAAMLTTMLHDSGLFQRVDGAIDDAPVSRYAKLFPYRFQLVGADTVAALQSRPQTIVDVALATALGPFGVYQMQQLTADPLGLFPHYLGALAPRGIDLFEGRTPMIHRGNEHYAVLVTTAATGAFDLDKTNDLLTLVGRARTWAAAQNVELLVTGIPLFTATNAERAQFEVSTVGTGSMIGVILLFTLTFRSIRPFVLATIAITTGLLVAVTVSIWLFDRVHLLTFVFGATLIGVCDDYALHYVCDAFRGPNWTPKDATRRVLPGLALGLLTTLTAYASLGVAPFPALRQIAVFCGSGLLGAWLTVLLFLPSHTVAMRSTPALMRVGLWYARRFPSISDRWVFAGVVLACGALAALFYGSQPSDDVRLLQSKTPRLTQESAQIAALITDQHDSQYLLVEGDTIDATLAAEASVRVVLDRLANEHKLHGYWAISSVYPTPAAQAEHYRLLKAGLYDSGSIRTLFDALHTRPGVFEEHLAEFGNASGHVVLLDEWLAAVGEPWSDLWLGCATGRCASVITLNGYANLDAKDIAALAATGGVSVVDRVSEISAIMAKYRVIAGQLLAGAYALAALLMCMRYGVRRGVRILIVPVGAALITVATLIVLGFALNLFTVCALLLVVGMAFDDAIFFGFHGRASAPTALAVLLSATTTLISFGLLSLSSTPVVRDFGITLALGVATAYLLAPIAAVSSQHQESHENAGTS